MKILVMGIHDSRFASKLLCLTVFRIVHFIRMASFWQRPSARMVRQKMRIFQVKRIFMTEVH